MVSEGGRKGGRGREGETEGGKEGGRETEGGKEGGRERQGGRTNDVLFLDLADGGAEHFAQTVREIKQR